MNSLWLNLSGTCHSIPSLLAGLIRDLECRDLCVNIISISFIIIIIIIQQDPKPGALDSSRGVRSRSGPEFLSLGPFSRNETDVICIYHLV